MKKTMVSFPAIITVMVLAAVSVMGPCSFGHRREDREADGSAGSGPFQLDQPIFPENAGGMSRA
jgi:hypothetical protein